MSINLPLKYLPFEVPIRLSKHLEPTYLLKAVQYRRVNWGTHWPRGFLQVAWCKCRCWDEGESIWGKYNGLSFIKKHIVGIT